MNPSDPIQSYPGERLLNLKEVMSRCNLSRSTLYRLEKHRLFPARRKISPGRCGYLESEIIQWMAKCEQACRWAESINIAHLVPSKR